MKIVLVAKDFAPSKTLGMLAEQFDDAVTFLGGTGGTEEIAAAVRDAAVVVVGMSYTPEASALELHAIEKAPPDAVVVAWADSSGSVRDWFVEAKRQPDVVLACMPSEAKRAKERLPDAQVYMTGNPLWMGNIRATQHALQMRSGIREGLGVSEDTTLVFVPLRKERKLNEAHLRSLVRAAELLSTEQPALKFAITTHPGEPDAEKGREVYNEIVVGNPAFSFANTKTPLMLAAADIVADPGTGVSVEAMFSGRRVIVNTSAPFRKEFARLQGGRDTWEPCELRAALSATNAREFANAITTFLDDGEVVQAIEAAQAAHYPPPGPNDDPVQTMREVIYRYMPAAM